MIDYSFSITDPVSCAEKTAQYRTSKLMFLLRDPRDVPFVHLLIKIHLTVIPVAVLLYLPVLQGIWWWAVAIPYFYVAQFYFKGSFGLMLHCFCHRKTWKPAYQWVQKYVLWFLCPFFGHLGEGYYSHHIGMHHIAGNMPEDTSSTMHYQRDSKRDFFRYWMHFMALGVYETCQYFIKKKMPRFYIPLSWSEILFFVAAFLLCFVNLKATLVVFIVPFLFARFVMMLGNWTQHAFVDKHAPEDELASTIICINTGYNHKCWNDGYHAFHHLRQAAHYTEYPVMFQKHLPDLAARKTFIFHGIHYLHIFIWLMGKRYDKLVQHLVNINQTFTSEADAIALMKERTARFSG